MKTCDTALVVPSIRKDSFERFIKEWQPTGLFERVDLILVEDNPERTFTCNVEGSTHLCWKDIDKNEWSWIIPRRSDTVRSFGYWYAWKLGYEYLMTLDDDCYPEPGYEQLDVIHKQFLTRTKWFNTLNNVRPRGTPYKNLGERKVYVNHGLWTNVLDYDAPQQLVNPIPETFTHDNRIVPHGAYHSFCGMNAMWRREAIPLSYHLLMGQRIGEKDFGGCPRNCPDFDAESSLTKLPFDRWGDIGCGIIQKKICDHLGWAVSTGTPYIHHDRASNPFTNLRKEAAAIEINEWLWEAIDNIGLTNKTTAVQCYHEMGKAIYTFGRLGYQSAAEYKEYFELLGRAMMCWAQLFS